MSETIRPRRFMKVDAALNALSQFDDDDLSSLASISSPRAKDKTPQQDSDSDEDNVPLSKLVPHSSAQLNLSAASMASSDDDHIPLSKLIALNLNSKPAPVATLDDSSNSLDNVPLSKLCQNYVYDSSSDDSYSSTDDEPLSKYLRKKASEGDDDSSEDDNIPIFQYLMKKKQATLPLRTITNQRNDTTLTQSPSPTKKQNTTTTTKQEHRHHHRPYKPRYLKGLYDSLNEFLLSGGNNSSQQNCLATFSSFSTTNSENLRYDSDHEERNKEACEEQDEMLQRSPPLPYVNVDAYYLKVKNLKRKKRFKQKL